MLDAILYGYSITGITPKPDSIFYPKNLSELWDIVESAVKNDRYLLIKGYRTSIIRIDNLSNLTKGIYIISTKNLNNITITNNSLTVSSGIKWYTLFSLLLESKSRPAIYPLFSIKSSIGGLIATNNMQFYDGKYGLANYLVKISLFSSDGLITVTSRKRDIIGSLGCLGLIGEVELSPPDNTEYDVDIHVNSKSESNVIYVYRSLSSMDIPLRLATLYKFNEKQYSLYLITSLRRISELELSHILSKLSREVNVKYELVRDPKLFIDVHRRFLYTFINSLHNLKACIVYISGLQSESISTFIFNPQCYVFDLLGGKGIFIFKKLVNISEVDASIIYQYEVSSMRASIRGSAINRLNSLKSKYDVKLVFPSVRS